MPEVTQKSKISICVPCYNEEHNVIIAYDRISAAAKSLDASYEYEIIFADNNSQDGTREKIRGLCADDPEHVKAIFNEKNVGVDRSCKHLLYESDGDAVILIPCDMQEPPELIEKFVDLWSQGNKIVLGQRTDSKNTKSDRMLRNFYYSIIKKFADAPIYPHVSGFGILDRSVIDVLERINDTVEADRYIYGELGYDVILVPYTQAAREYGKSSYGSWAFFDFGVQSLCSISQKPLRLMTIFGMCSSAVLILIGIIYLVMKLLYWDDMGMGMAPVLLGVFFIGSVQLFCLGLIGEYVSILIQRQKNANRPLVIESERINFDRKENNAY